MTEENTPTLYTQRLILILRKSIDNDIPGIYELLKDTKVNTFFPWFPIKDMAKAKSFLRDCFLNYYKQPFAYRYAICLKENNQPIVYIRLSEDINKGPSFAIGGRDVYGLWPPSRAESPARAGAFNAPAKRPAPLLQSRISAHVRRRNPSRPVSRLCIFKYKGDYSY